MHNKAICAVCRTAVYECDTCHTTLCRCTVVIHSRRCRNVDSTRPPVDPTRSALQQALELAHATTLCTNCGGLNVVESSAGGYVPCDYAHHDARVGTHGSVLAETRAIAARLRLLSHLARDHHVQTNGEDIAPTIACISEELFGVVK